MRWLDKIERRFDWLHFPGLFKYLTFLGVIAYACQWTRPDFAAMLDFDRAKILSGEVWRVFTFLFAPMGMQRFTPIGVLFLFFAVRISFLISDSLEEAWGSTRLTLYILTAWVGLAVSQFIFDPGLLASGSMLYISLFLAFATLFPRVEFALFFLIPVQVRILGWITGILMLLNVFRDPSNLAITVPTLLPYLLWVLPDVIHGRKSLVKAAERRRKFQVASRVDSQAFHRCETCGRTERDSGDLEFYTLPDGKEYCSEHLPPQP
ncbi:hypothetical protein OKA04_06190 [Luteolibacter flavescens]|uniref:Peptidase S54 rhomboid domain-containing protein n=1 Tax=Luteolibacter flavescens TaxID=1859460 RepID=A0ABT3FL64_9BACT|nr:hypothetical protein [Luteolibacter flavescens]MCW1884313.1 hypothetical protein [Luteolibacter flavescens]